MKILTCYLTKDLLHNFLLFLGIFVVVVLVQQIYDTRDNLVEGSWKLSTMIKFFTFSIPPQMSQMMPMMGLMTTIFAYGMLAKNREVLAMVSAGVSFRFLAIPALIFGVALTLFMFWFTERVAPYCAERAKILETVEIKHKKINRLTDRKDLFLKGAGNRFYYVQVYLAERHEMRFPIIYEMAPDGSGISERVEAANGRLLKGGNGHTWEFNGVERWRFKPDGMVDHYEKIATPVQMTMEQGLDKLLQKQKKPEDMSIQELGEKLRLLRQKGGENLQSYRTVLQIKLAFPVAGLLMALLGFAVVVDVHARHFAKGVFTGLLVAIGFYVLNAVFNRLGRAGTISPLAAGWAPIALFGMGVYVLYLRLNKIRG